MTAWDIHLAEAHHVLQNASASAEDYATDEAKVTESLGQLAMALPNSPHVSMRLGEFADEVIYPHLQKIFDDTSAAFEGTSMALIAYEEGDTQMVRNAQLVAAQAPRPDAPRAPGAGFRFR